jgi:hypothetical protein
MTSRPNPLRVRGDFTFLPKSEEFMIRANAESFAQSGTYNGTVGILRRNGIK